ncbi:unnamed protein product [Lactuca virosa]|uniref:Uncharacterized protein n=1 Tax=Lactuca virosa TaxID=75947 RepID=A0AAU9NCP4_9ASTR|nr:unnamed protein product [Lactuca virosa]
MKLQQVSHHYRSLILDDSMNSDTSTSMATNEASVAVNASIHSRTSSKEEPHGNLSVLYMFSRYKTSRNDNKNSFDGSTAMTKESEEKCTPRELYQFCS